MNCIWNEGKLPSRGSLYLFIRVIKQTVVIIEAYHSLSTAYILPNTHL